MVRLDDAFDLRGRKSGWRCKKQVHLIKSLLPFIYRAITVEVLAPFANCPDRGVHRALRAQDEHVEPDLCKPPVQRAAMAPPQRMQNEYIGREYVDADVHVVSREKCAIELKLQWDGDVGERPRHCVQARRLARPWHYCSQDPLFSRPGQTPRAPRAPFCLCPSRCLGPRRQSARMG